MALSDIVLAKGQVIVILSDSLLGILPADGGAINFGTIQAVNDLCDTVEVGASVQFDKNKAIPFMIISGQIFYMANESDITGIENIIP